MLKISAVLLALLGITSSAQAKWEVRDAKFSINEITRIKTGNQQNVDRSGPSSGAYWQGQAFWTGNELHGAIDIHEYNEDTLSSRDTHIDNVYMLLRTYGLILRAGTIHDVEIPIQGLQGKTISSIFKSQFNGGKIAIGIGFLAGVYPNASLLVNNDGLWIPNLESILRLADLNVGVEIAYVTMKFKLKSLKADAANETINASGMDANHPRTETTVTVEKLLNQKLGE